MYIHVHGVHVPDWKDAVIFSLLSPSPAPLYGITEKLYMPQGLRWPRVKTQNVSVILVQSGYGTGTAVSSVTL